MRAISFVSIVVTTLAVSVVPGKAQGLEQPLRSSPPPDPARTTQQLTISASALGGYDDSLAGQGAIIQSPDTVEGGYTGFADVGLRYWRGTPVRSFSLDGSGYLLSYSNSSIDSPVGGNVRVGGATTLGRSTRIEVAQLVSTDPYVSFGAFGPLEQDLGAGAGPDANPVNGLTPHRSWGTDSAASVAWNLTRRATLSASYDYSRNEFAGDFGFDNRTHSAELTFDRAVTRTVSARGSYRFSDTLVADRTRDDEGRPIVDHTAEAGFGYTKQLSPSRRVEVAAGAGATRVRTVGELALRDLEFWAPTGHALARIDLGRTWAALASYRRGVTLLDSISSEPFLADAVLLQAEGTFSRRVELTFSAGYSNGAQQVGLLTDQYETLTLSAETEVVIGRSWAAVVSYSRNDYRLFGLSADLGRRSGWDTNAIRVGMSYSITLLPPRAERPGRPGRSEN